ncbi:MAG TPA: chain length determinant protein EpsF, partial [Burkholderiales bacterium]|nr:chain length determinant protein EpsF [Burkholderiales bacterium]
APLEPSFPKPLGKTMLMAIAAGILLGVGAAFLLEMLDRRIRTTDDLVDVLKLPVLGVIARAREPRRLGIWRQHTPLLAK